MSRETAVVVAPGRGTYNASELGYLHRHFAADHPLLRAVDDYRSRHDRVSLSELDGAEKFSAARHTPGGNAAGLIYACALADYLAIDRERYDIVAVTGNSMGWYLALAAAGVTDASAGGIALVEEMARMMDEKGCGGQLVYPLVDAQWRPAAAFRQAVVAVLQAAPDGELFTSIRLGGSVVLAGTDQALRDAQAQLPPIDDRFPLRLARHAAFHTPLLEDVSRLAMAEIPEDLFGVGNITLIDGRGDVWAAGSDPQAVRDYTLGHQVVATYDFTAAVRTAVREFAPDRIIVLGPGTAMGAPVLQTLAGIDWLGLSDRNAWQLRQQQDPYVLGMGLPAQRSRVVAG